MRWFFVLWLVVGAIAPAAAATMTTSIDNADFGSAHVGSAGTTTRTITINNTDTGGAAMTFNVVSDDPDYVAVPASGSIAPSGSQAVVITFTPSSRGARPATLTVSGSDTVNPSDPFSVTGIGTSGNLVVTWTGAPSALDFGAVPVTAGSPTRTVTLSNPAPANESLLISLAITAGNSDFSAPTTTNVSIPVDQSIDVTLTFNPTTGDVRTGTATITSNDAFTTTFPVPLTGAGLDLVSSGTVDFGNTVLVGSNDTKTLFLTNFGEAAIQITAVASGNSVFEVTPNETLPKTLQPAENLAVTVKFTPVNGLAVASDITVTHTGYPSPLQVPVLGDGLYKDVAITAANEADLMIDLGPRRVGVLFSQVVTVTNTGETTQTLNLPTSSSTACVVMPTSPAALPDTLAAGASATFEIRVTPAVVGVGTCTVTVTTNIPSTDSIVVDWQGVAPEVGLATPTTPSINFGVIDVDATQVFRTVVLDNTGSAPLAVGPCTITGSARFSVETSCANLTVAVGSSVTLMIGFDPMVEAAETGTLTIGVDALTTQQVAIALSGVGADQRLDLSALSVSFPDTNVAASEAPIAYIDVFNAVNPATGVAETLDITSVTSDNEVFTLANEGPFTVMGGAMIRLAITFHPEDAGTYEGTLTIVSNASGQPMAVIALSGRGVVEASSEGGGCCETGDSRSSLLALLVLGLVVRRRHSARWRR
jgi:hypothetical protein